MVKKRGIESFVLNVFAFLLVWEWFRPLDVIGEVTNKGVFVFFLALSFLIAYLGIHWIANVLIHVGFILFATNFIFYSQNIESKSFVANLILDIQTNLTQIFSQNWGELTDSFRTFLMFLFIWLIVYLLNYWITVQKRAFLFLLLTIVYLAVIDSFAPYNANIAIVRTFLIGLLLLGILFLIRLVETERLKMKSVIQSKWIISIMVIVIASASIGVLVPKAGPIWPDPLPFLQSFATHHDNGLGSGSGKIGYDPDDSRLGGSFRGDDTVVFHAATTEREYWKVEVKDEYTGKGWVLSQSDNKVSVNFEDEVPFEAVEEEFYAEEDERIIIEFMNKNSSHPVYPHGLSKLEFFSSSNQYTVNLSNEFVSWPSTNEENGRSLYSAIYKKPEYEIYALREIIGFENSITVEEEEFIKRYTQLPDSLPERVKELAESITANEENWYDKARAIESYLKSYRFTYRTEDVPYPEANQDYVDQFLFETMYGYCDNFSTSMVVLLRSIGIPARWVKGYTAGDELNDSNLLLKYMSMSGLELESGNYSVYEVTNNNAHSWVEAYLPGIGWVPFEPTKGFDNIAEFYYDLSKSPDIDPIERPEVNEPKQPEQPEKPETPSQPDQTGGSSGLNFSFGEFFGKVFNIFLYVIPAAIITVALLFLFRKKWYPYWLLFKYRNKQDHKSFMRAYLSLMKQLKWIGIPIKNGETLRNYAKYVDHYYNMDDMSVLTNYYEKAFYGKQDHDLEWDIISAKWKSLLRNIMKK